MLSTPFATILYVAVVLPSVSPICICVFSASSTASAVTSTGITSYQGLCIFIGISIRLFSSSNLYTSTVEDSSSIFSPLLNAGFWLLFHVFICFRFIVLAFSMAPVLPLISIAMRVVFPVLLMVDGSGISFS